MRVVFATTVNAIYELSLWYNSFAVSAVFVYRYCYLQSGINQSQKTVQYF